MGNQFINDSGDDQVLLSASMTHFSNTLLAFGETSMVMHISQQILKTQPYDIPKVWCAELPTVWVLFLISQFETQSHVFWGQINLYQQSLPANTPLHATQTKSYFPSKCKRSTADKAASRLWCIWPLTLCWADCFSALTGQLTEFNHKLIHRKERTDKASHASINMFQVQAKAFSVLCPKSMSIQNFLLSADGKKNN